MKTQLIRPSLIAHFEIEQGSDAWHQIRYGKVGGVRAKSLLGKPETLINEIGSCQLEPYSPEDDCYVNAAMQRGIDLEPKARAEMAEYIGVELFEVGWLQSTTYPLLGISPDGISADLTIQIEAKCPGKNKHAATLYGGVIPDDHIEQCLHAFTVNPYLKTLYFGSFRPECEYPLFVKSIDMESLVDLCTKAKPVVKKVSEWVEIMRAAALVLEANVKTYNENLKRI
jgi:hypothetical protein